jgi:hypothetical protein
LDTTDNRAFTIFTVKLEQIEERTEQRGGQEEKRKPKQKKAKILQKICAKSSAVKEENVTTQQ